MYGTYDPASGRVWQVKRAVTEQVLLHHLQGKQPYGVYLLVRDRIRAMAVDFDENDLLPPTDFIAAAEHLIAGGYTRPEKLAVMGRSAGGLLMGAITNLRPDLFQAVIAGVPFFDSLSFSFLSYVSFSFAQFFMSSLWRQGLDVQRVTPRRVRNSAFVLFLGAVLMVVIDLITDPVTHLGRYWFLGEIYYYPDPGYHFSVPLANYAGWFVVGWLIIFINQRIDALLAAGEKRGQVTLRHLPFKGLFAPLFWAGIVLFQLGVTYWVAFSGVIEPEATTMGEANLTVIVRAQAISGTFVIVPILLLALAHLLRRGSEASPAEVSDWLEEYPCDKLKQRLV